MERGRTVFEGLLDSYPKRVDLWNVYADKETKAGEYDKAREIFKRVTTLKLSSKAIKGVGPKLAALLVHEFGARTLDVLLGGCMLFGQGILCFYCSLGMSIWPTSLAAPAGQRAAHQAAAGCEGDRQPDAAHRR